VLIKAGNAAPRPTDAVQTALFRLLDRSTQPVQD